MGEPVSTALLLKSAVPIASGLAGYGQAQAVKRQAEINSYIGKTRAIQTDTAQREGLNAEMATLRATFAAMGQRPGVGTGEIFNEMRAVRSRERRIEVGNRNQEARDFTTQAKNAASQGRATLLSSLIRSGPDLRDLHEYSTADDAGREALLARWKKWGR